MITKANFVITKTNQSISSLYRFITLLGKGGFGDIYRVQNMSTGMIYACKQLNKSSIQNFEQFQTELALLKQSDHPHIIRLYEVIEDKSNIYLIMEECLGGTLFNRIALTIKQGQMFTEILAKRIFKQIIEAVNYLHSHGVCHRDIKPDNIMFSSIEEDSSIKLIDFGLSKIFSIDQWQNSNIVGTPMYMAPEVFQGKYNEKCDIWSCGVILYILLSGRAPFYSKDQKELIEMITKSSISFAFPEFDNVSSQAKDLMNKMVVDQEKRISASEVLQHEWFNYDTKHNFVFLSVTYNKMSQYANLNIFQKSVIFRTTLNLSMEETQSLSKIFKGLDKNSDGVLTYNEITSAIGSSSSLSKKVNMKQLNYIFSSIDLDSDSLVNYSEFITSIYDYNKKMRKKQLLHCFMNYDQDNNGMITFDELISIIRPKTEEQKANLLQLYQSLDKNGDNGIDFEEFVNGMDIKIPIQQKKRNILKNTI